MAEPQSTNQSERLRIDRSDYNYRDERRQRIAMATAIIAAVLAVECVGSYLEPDLFGFLAKMAVAGIVGFATAKVFEYAWGLRRD